MEKQANYEDELVTRESGFNSHTLLDEKDRSELHGL